MFITEVNGVFISIEIAFFINVGYLVVFPFLFFFLVFPVVFTIPGIFIPFLFFVNGLGIIIVVVFVIIFFVYFICHVGRRCPFLMEWLLLLKRL